MSEAYRKDHILMQRVAAGDARAFRELSDQHLGSIMTFSKRLLSSDAEAEDVCQETFLRAWKNAHKYQPKARISTWLHTIARNLAIDRMRRRGTRGDEFQLDDELDPAPPSGRPSQLLERKREALRLEQALERLPERQRTAILLCHEQGFTNPQISGVLECSVEAVESLLSRGRRQLRLLIEAEEDLKKVHGE